MQNAEEWVHQFQDGRSFYENMVTGDTSWFPPGQDRKRQALEQKVSELDRDNKKRKQYQDPKTASLEEKVLKLEEKTTSQNAAVQRKKDEDAAIEKPEIGMCVLLSHTSYQWIPFFGFIAQIGFALVLAYRLEANSFWNIFYVVLATLLLVFFVVIIVPSIALCTYEAYRMVITECQKLMKNANCRAYLLVVFAAVFLWVLTSVGLAVLTCATRYIWENKHIYLGWLSASCLTFTEDKEPKEDEDGKVVDTEDKDCPVVRQVVMALITLLYVTQSYQLLRKFPPEVSIWNFILPSWDYFFNPKPQIAGMASQQGQQHNKKQNNLSIWNREPDVTIWESLRKFEFLYFSNGLIMPTKSHGFDSIMDGPLESLLYIINLTIIASDDSITSMIMNATALEFVYKMGNELGESVFKRVAGVPGEVMKASRFTTKATPGYKGCGKVNVRDGYDVTVKAVLFKMNIRTCNADGELTFDEGRPESVLRYSVEDADGAVGKQQLADISVALEAKILTKLLGNDPQALAAVTRDDQGNVKHVKDLSNDEMEKYWKASCGVPSPQPGTPKTFEVSFILPPPQSRPKDDEEAMENKMKFEKSCGVSVELVEHGVHPGKDDGVLQFLLGVVQLVLGFLGIILMNLAPLAILVYFVVQWPCFVLPDQLVHSGTNCSNPLIMHGSKCF